MFVRIDANNTSATLAAMKEKWQDLVPFRPFEASYLTDDLNHLYRSESNQAFLVRGACFLTVLMACLGLIGLAANAAERRTREIGVRKVLGSTVMGIVLLVTRRFVALVALANLAACPIAYYALSQWLDNFVYKIDLGWQVFALTITITLGVAVLAVNAPVIRAARANPVEALRYE
jgi:putative ABC transport system permease protein